MSAQIWKKNAVVSQQRLSGWLPQVVISGKWMEQNNRRPAAQNFKKYLGVTTGNLGHRQI